MAVLTDHLIIGVFGKQVGTKIRTFSPFPTLESTLCKPNRIDAVRQVLRLCHVTTDPGSGSGPEDECLVLTEREKTNA